MMRSASNTVFHAIGTLRATPRGIDEVDMVFDLGAVPGGRDRVVNTIRSWAEEIANGGLVSRQGNLVTLGNGAKWWLNGEQWARDSADSLIVIDRARQVERTKQ